MVEFFNRLLRLQGGGRESRGFIRALDIAAAADRIATAAPMQGETYNVAAGRAALVKSP
jgi:UDP-glucose 4-epimerase